MMRDLSELDLLLKILDKLAFQKSPRGREWDLDLNYH